MQLFLFQFLEVMELCSKNHSTHTHTHKYITLPWPLKSLMQLYGCCYDMHVMDILRPGKVNSSPNFISLSRFSTGRKQTKCGIKRRIGCSARLVLYLLIWK